ncbi:MAG: HD domain-containing protein [Bacteroidales bacterium]|nr:HD domain-containing protein [Bacteroidales bacterium]
MVRPELKAYVEQRILPQHLQFDDAHHPDHILRVMAQSMELAQHYPQLNKEMVYTIAAFHDIGVCEGRELHHLVSGRIIRQNTDLLQWFSPDQIETMAQAAEDHRASATQSPRSLYGMIVAEADRDIEPLSILRRTVQYGLSYYPQLDKEGHWQRTLQHLEEKYSPNGYLKLFIPQSRNKSQMIALQALIADTARLRALFDQIYSQETLSNPQ